MSVPEKLKPYAGRIPRIDDALTRAAHVMDTTMSERFYPEGTADWDQKATQVLLNQETADWLYTRFTPLTLRYVAGSRPVLERIVARLTRPGMTEQEQVLAILRYAWDGFRQEWPLLGMKPLLVLNAREEELLKLGGGQCEDRSRLIICLCQVAGFPARFVSSSSYFQPEKGYTSRGGHAIVEIFFEGGWAFFDSMCSYYWLKPDGRFASLWELIQNPDLSRTQIEAVLRDCGKTREQFIRYHETNLIRRQAITLTNYFVWEGGKYDWKWLCCDSVIYTQIASGQTPGSPPGQLSGDALRRQLLAEIGVAPGDIR